MIRRGYVVLVVAYVILASGIFFDLTNKNASSEFNITIVYQEHRWIETFTDHDHSYDTITINAQVTVSNYESIFQQFHVSIYPFRVDVSQWQNGDTVTIGGSSYEATSSGGSWIARRDLGIGDYVKLVYDGTTGVFVSSYSKVSGTDMDFMDNYFRQIAIESSNLGNLVAAITGSNIVLNIGLLTGIVVEIPLFLWLNQKRAAQQNKEKISEPHHSATDFSFTLRS